MRLGQVRLLKEDWDGAIAALKSGLAKGGVDDPGAAEQLLGITYYNAGKLGEARSLVREVAPLGEGPPGRPRRGSSTSTKRSQKQSGEAGAAGSVGM